MKLCPQCAFVYEDRQRFCDMDGQVLVPEAAPVVTQPKVPPPTRLTINIPPSSDQVTERVTDKKASRRLPVLIAVGLVLVTLLAVLCFAQLYRSRLSEPVQSSEKSPARSAAQHPDPQPAPDDLVSSTSVGVAPLPGESPEESPEEFLSSPGNSAAAGSPPPAPRSSPSPSSATSVAAARLASSPVSAGAQTANSRRGVVVRLTNGAIISADEAWEKREGVWYRQAGLVTFVKRSRVRTIERLAPPEAQAKSAASKGNDRSRKSEKSAGQNQLRLRQLEAADTKKQSRLSSFLKVTGRILKKPFKL